MTFFEWDEQKAKRNLIKHSVSFEEASTIFGDRGLVTFYDAFPSEDRFIAIGYSELTRLLLVVYCGREADIFRIISARRPTRKERKSYEEGI
jgi:uncharacterized DUF497 family protein